MDDRERALIEMSERNAVAAEGYYSELVKMQKRAEAAEEKVERLESEIESVTAESVAVAERNLELTEKLERLQRRWRGR